MIRLVGPRPYTERNDAFDKYIKGTDAFKPKSKKNEPDFGESAQPQGA